MLGGGDFRLANRAYNIWGSERADNHFTVEIDATDPAAPLLNLYAVGMPTAFREATEEPAASLNIGEYLSGDAAGYKAFILEPTVGGSFTSASGSFESDYGAIESGWTAADGAITGYHCAVPANTTATLYLPITRAQADALTLPEGMTFTGMEAHNGGECAVFALLSGRYELAIG